MWDFTLQGVKYLNIGPQGVIQGISLVFPVLYCIFIRMKFLTSVLPNFFIVHSPLGTCPMTYFLSSSSRPINYKLPRFLVLSLYVWYFLVVLLLLLSEFLCFLQCWWCLILTCIRTAPTILIRLSLFYLFLLCFLYVGGTGRYVVYA